MPEIYSKLFFALYSMYYGGVVKSGVHACLSGSRVRIPSSPQIGQIAQSVEHFLKNKGSAVRSASGHNGIASNRVHNCINQNCLEK